eukprot:5204047-Prymnesium_polylepis.1
MFPGYPKPWRGPATPSGGRQPAFVNALMSSCAIATWLRDSRAVILADDGEWLVRPSWLSARHRFHSGPHVRLVRAQRVLKYPRRPHRRTRPSPAAQSRSKPTR